MTRRIYPLNALRAFECAARLLSFKKAAEEMHVTPAAISHQVKALEDYLGVQLFRRLSRGLLLTDEGQRSLPVLRDCFQQLDRVVESMRASTERGALTISVAPAFAMKWLIPRLEHFEEACPEIDLRLSASLGLVDFRTDGFDAAIRLGEGSNPGLKSLKLFDESLTPMCSPSLLNGDTPLRSPDDLRHHILLHDDSIDFASSAPRWNTWLDKAGVDDIDTSRGPHFSHHAHTLQAAIDGAGVVLGWQALAKADLAAGRLGAPFDQVLPMGLGFFLVYPESDHDRPKIVAFREWLAAELIDAGFENSLQAN